MTVPEYSEGLFRRLGLEAGGGVVMTPRCPALLITPFTEWMLEWFSWLESWRKTPYDLGVSSSEELDPRYYAAMQVLKRETARLNRERIDRIKSGRGQAED